MGAGITKYVIENFQSSGGKAQRLRLKKRPLLSVITQSLQALEQPRNLFF